MAQAVVASGNRPVFADIDLADYNMRLDALKAALTPRTRAVVATHMFGYPADVAAIRRAIGDDRLFILEDAALALRPGRGLSGDAAFFSFGRGKQLYAIGGGVMLTDSPDLYEKMRVHRDRMMSRLPRGVWARRSFQVLTAYLAQSAAIEGQLMRLKRRGVVRRARESIGLAPSALPRDYATALAGFQARLGLAQLRKLEAVLDRSQALACFYTRELSGVRGLTPAPILPGATYTYYTVRVERRDETDFCRRMLSAGVEVGRNFSYALPQQDAYRSYANGSYPQAERAAREVVNLPAYAGLNSQTARRVVERVRRALE
jgi:dTDP-4-amino-4,6-dideoxygalactose transaminase